MPETSWVLEKESYKAHNYEFMTKPKHINHNLWLVHDTMRKTVTSETRSTFNIATSYFLRTFFDCITFERKKKGGKNNKKERKRIGPA